MNDIRKEIAPSRSRLATDFPNSDPTAKRHGIARRFAILGSGLAILIAVVICSHLLPWIRGTEHPISQGHDLLPSYAAGELVRTGHARSMYDLETVLSIEDRVAGEARLQIEPHYGPWLNPPFFALLFAPLSALGYRAALAVFAIFNLTLLGISLWMLSRMMNLNGGTGVPPVLPGQRHGRDARATKRIHFALVPLLLMTSMPFLQALFHQQNTFISLFLLCSIVTCWRADRALLAGIFAGLLFFKPQLALIVAVALVFCLGWCAIAGMAVSGVVLLAINLIALPGTLGDFLFHLRPIIHWLRSQSHYNWGRQVTFTGFWRLLVQGNGPGDVALSVTLLSRVCAAGIAVALVVAGIRTLRQRSNVRRYDRLIAATVACMPLMMPYYMDYDLLLMAIPAVLFAADWIHRGHAPAPTADRWLLGAWVALFVLTEFNPGVSAETRVNLIVPALVAVAVISLWWCARKSGKRTAQKRVANYPASPPDRTFDTLPLVTAVPQPAPNTSIPREIASAYVASASRIASWVIISAIVYRKMGANAFALLALVRGTIGILNYTSLGLAPAIVNSVSRINRSHVISQVPAARGAAPLLDYRAPREASPLAVLYSNAMTVAGGACGVGCLLVLVYAKAFEALFQVPAGTEDAVASVVMWMGLGVVFRLLGDTPGAVLQACGRITFDNSISAIGEMSWAVLVAGIALSSVKNLGQPGMLMCTAVSYGFCGGGTFIARWLAARAIVGGKPKAARLDWRIARSLLAFGLLVVFAQLADYLYAPTDYILINRLLPPVEVANYVPAVQIDAGLLFLVTGLASVMLPRRPSRTRRMISLRSGDITFAERSQALRS